VTVTPNYSGGLMLFGSVKDASTPASPLRSGGDGGGPRADMVTRAGALDLTTPTTGSS
jgi:hypothetical protein